MQEIEEKTIEILERSMLFKYIQAEDFSHLLNCLNAQFKSYENDAYIFYAGDTIDYFGIVLQGSIEVVKDNRAGDRNIIAFLEPGHLFGEGIVCTSRRKAPVSVKARERTTVLMLPYERMIKTCGSACSFHAQLISNMLSILGDKNYALNVKMELLLLKGMRAKLAAYLLNEGEKSGSLSFNITPNRTALAEFLNVSRPSMCRELGRMKEEGLIDFYKNSFKLLDTEALKNSLS